MDGGAPWSDLPSCHERIWPCLLQEKSDWGVRFWSGRGKPISSGANFAPRPRMCEHMEWFVLKPIFRPLPSVSAPRMSELICQSADTELITKTGVIFKVNLAVKDFKYAFPVHTFFQNANAVYRVLNLKAWNLIWLCWLVIRLCITMNIPLS